MFNQLENISFFVLIEFVGRVKMGVLTVDTKIIQEDVK